MSHPFPAAYRAAQRATGGCPIEAGALGRLVDHECSHGRLPGDRTPRCGCWPQENATVTPLQNSRVSDTTAIDTTSRALRAA